MAVFWGVWIVGDRQRDTILRDDFDQYVIDPMVLTEDLEAEERYSTGLVARSKAA